MPGSSYQRLKLGLTVLVLLLPIGCQPEGPPLTERRAFALGTWVDMAWPADADAGLGGEVQRQLGRYGRDLYAYGDGELGRLNSRLPEGNPISVSPELLDLLRRGMDWHEQSQGTLDPGIGALVRLWGFAGEPQPRPRPSAQTLAELLPEATIAQLRVDGDRVWTRSPNLVIDLSAYAKGYVVDQLIELLRASGATSGFINAGGDLRALGTRPSGGPWRIAIQHPRRDGVLGVIALAPGEAAFTSGDYARYYLENGDRRHHILDPRTGEPAVETQAITVVAASGIEADAAATALFVAGADWPELAAKLGIERVLRVDGEGRISMSAEMATQFTLSEGIEADIMGE